MRKQSRLSPAAQAEVQAVYRALPLETASEFEDLTFDMRAMGLLPTFDPLDEQVSAVRHFHNVCEMRDPNTYGATLARRSGEVTPRYTRRHI